MQRLNKRYFCQKSPFEIKLVPFSQRKWRGYLGQRRSCWHQRTSWINKRGDLRAGGGWRSGGCSPNDSPTDCCCQNTVRNTVEAGGSCGGRRLATEERVTGTLLLMADHLEEWVSVGVQRRFPLEQVGNDALRSPMTHMDSSFAL